MPLRKELRDRSAVVQYVRTVRNRLLRLLRGNASAPLVTEPAARPQIRPAVHRTIVVVDVEGFGDSRRTNAHQLVVRRSLYEILGQAFDKAGVPWGACDHEDRGDGVLVLVPPTVAKTALAEFLPPQLVTALRAHNSVHCPEEQIRLRMSVHAGEIHYDEHGVVGRAVNLTFRLLDARVLREALAGSSRDLVVIASSWFFDEVIWHSRMADPDSYQRVRVSSKETDVMAWMRILP